MSQYYVESETDARRCQEAVRSQQPITITGYTSNDSLRAYSGRVQSVEDNGEAKGRWRWRVTILDG